MSMGDPVIILDNLLADENLLAVEVLAANAKVVKVVFEDLKEQVFLQNHLDLLMPNVFEHPENYTKVVHYAFEIRLVRQPF